MTVKVWRHAWADTECAFPAGDRIIACALCALRGAKHCRFQDGSAGAVLPRMSNTESGCSRRLRTAPSAHEAGDVVRDGAVPLFLQFNEALASVPVAGSGRIV